MESVLKRHFLPVLALVLAALAGSCNVDLTQRTCDVDSDCTGGQVCRPPGFCVDPTNDYDMDPIDDPVDEPDDDRDDIAVDDQVTGEPELDGVDPSDEDTEGDEDSGAAETDERDAAEDGAEDPLDVLEVVDDIDATDDSDATDESGAGDDSDAVDELGDLTREPSDDIEVLEGDEVEIEPSHVEFTHTTEAAEDITITLASEPEYGILLLDDGEEDPVELSEEDTFTQADIDEGSIWYRHDGSETIADTFELTASAAETDVLGPESFDVVLTPVNDPPVISTDAPEGASEDVELRYDADVLDPDGPGATWSKRVADTCGGTLESETGVYTFTPEGPVPATSCTLAIQVCDLGVPEQCGEQRQSIAITPSNGAPTISDIGDQVTLEDTPLVDLPFTVGDLDTSHAALVVSLASNTNPGLCSASFGGSGSSRTVTVTLADDGSGSCMLTVRVWDGETGVEDAFTVTVSPVNDPPVFSTSPPSSAMPEVQYAYDPQVADPDGPTQVWTKLEADTCGGEIVEGTGVYTFTPAGLDPATCVLAIRVCDGFTTEECATQQREIAISENQLPVLVNASVTVGEGGGITLTADHLSHTDPDGDDAAVTYEITAEPVHGTLTLDSTELGDGSTFAQADIDAGDVRYEHDGSETESDAIGLSVSDEVGGSISGSLAITVVPQNDFPTVTIEPAWVMVREGEVAGPISVVFADEETDPGDLDIEIISGNPTLAPPESVTLDGAGSSRPATVSPIPEQTGDVTITLRVTDEGGLHRIGSFTVTVAPECAAGSTYQASRAIELFEPCAAMSPAYPDACDSEDEAHPAGASSWQRTNEPIEVPLVDGEGTSLVPDAQPDFDDIRVTETAAGGEERRIPHEIIGGPHPHTRDNLRDVAAYWPLDGDLFDVVANRERGTVTGAGPDTGRFGDGDGAFAFGVDDQIELPGAGLMTGDAWTVEFWHRAGAEPSACARDTTLLSKNLEGVNDGDIEIAFATTDGCRLGVSVTHDGEATTLLGDAEAGYWAADTWHHIALVWSAKTLTLWVDGLPQADTYVADGQAAIADNGADILLGTEGPGELTWLDGAIDELLFHDVALPADVFYSRANPAVPTVRFMASTEETDTGGTYAYKTYRLYWDNPDARHAAPLIPDPDGGEPCLGLLSRCNGYAAWWRFDEGQGATFADSATGGAHGTGYGMSWTAGIDGVAASFDGEDDYAVVPDQSALDTGSELTISLLLSSTDLGDRTLLHKGASDDATQYSVRWAQGSPSVGWDLDFEAGAQWSATGAIDGGWHQLVGTFDGRAMELYVDGNQEGRRPESEGLAIVAGDLWLGSSRAGQRTQAMLDDLVIFDRALSPDERPHYPRSVPRVGEIVAEAPSCVEGALSEGQTCQADDDCASLNCANFHCVPEGYVYVPAGSFCMGSPGGGGSEECPDGPAELGRQANEGPLHWAGLTRPFLLHRDEATGGDWEAAFGGDALPSCGTPDHPACGLTWWAAAAFANAVSDAKGLRRCYELTGCDDNVVHPSRGMDCTDVRTLAPINNPYSCAGYRLPTEAEWEYAYRAGSDAAFYNGPITTLGCGDPRLDEIATYCNGSTREVVGTTTANRWGLHDMSGNVREWVSDMTPHDAPGYTAEAQIDPVGSGNLRIMRGGWARDEAQNCRAAYRNTLVSHGGAETGVRLARTVFPLHLEHCQDGVLNGNETDLDCGGRCVPCTELETCDANADCLSDNCDEGGRCVPAGFVFVPPGSLCMGSPGGGVSGSCSDAAAEAGRVLDESPLHEVTLTRGIFVAEHEVTQAEWDRVWQESWVNSFENPTSFPACGTDCPVETLNWWEAASYANAFSESEHLPPCYQLAGCSGNPGEDMECDSVTVLTDSGSPYDCEGYRLPTEAEWEYAYRSGTTTAFHNGGISETGCGSDANLEAIGWYCGNSGDTTHIVSPLDLEFARAPNAWGVYDMAGNVAEWVWDRYSTGYYADSPVEDPVGGEGALRVVRGGSYFSSAEECRAASRDRLEPDVRRQTVGFRLVRTAPDRD